jgi:DNA-binding transcriptional LysR family regulator
MDLNLVRTFARVVESRSFTAAARSLDLPKSSVSRAIARLEEQLGAQLLERTTRQLQLTATGRAYYDGASRALAALAEAEQMVAESQGEPRGTVRLTAPVGVDRNFLSDVVTRFAAEYPSIHVQVSFTNRVVDLVAEGFDLAIRGARGGRMQDSSLVARKVAQLSLWLFAAPSYLEAHRPPRRPADLKKHDCILFESKGTTSQTWELVGPRGPEPVDVAGVFSTDDFFFIRELVLRGAGITALVPRPDDLRSGALVRVLPEYEIPDLMVSIVIPSRKVPRRVALFREALIEGFKTLPGFGNDLPAQDQLTGT